MNKKIIVIDHKFFQRNLIKQIDTYLKVGLCKECKTRKNKIIVYPNGNTYCVHTIKECNKIFNKPYKKIAYLRNYELLTKGT